MTIEDKLQDLPPTSSHIDQAVRKQLDYPVQDYPSNKVLERIYSL